MTTRRMFLAGAVFAAAARPVGSPRLRLGVMDGVVRQSGKPEAVGEAKRFGLEGVQVTLGKSVDGKTLPLEDGSLQQGWVAASRQHAIPLDATYIDILHVNCLKNDPIARESLGKGIAITRKLDAGVLMTVFFGKCAVLNRQELDYVADVFKEFAREAEKADVLLGFENLLNADDNIRAMDRVGSNAFKIWYDVGNSTNRVGVDAPAEIRRLGRDRICQFHFKDEGYLGQGKVNMPEVLKAIGEIGFSGYANLETNSPSGNWERDLKRNVEFMRSLMQPAPA